MSSRAHAPLPLRPRVREHLPEVLVRHFEHVSTGKLAVAFQWRPLEIDGGSFSLCSGRLSSMGSRLE